MKILGIESSCDETAAAVVEDGRFVHSSVIASQVDEHKLYGGVVPEIASRRHCENIVQITKQALEKADTPLEKVDAIAVTYAPGLIGALLVGVNFAKGLSLATKKPLIPVHHIRSHIAANYIAYPDLKPPFLALVASGGHTHIFYVESYTQFSIIGRTRDDAAGEAFDKAARALGFPYPGGMYMDRAAQKGDASEYALPRPKVEGSVYDMSFSGLKTAVLNLINNSIQKGETIHKENLAASFQLAVCDILADKCMTAMKEYACDTIALAGGVVANTGLRSRFTEECGQRSYSLYLPPLNLCGDNAVMVASQGYYEFLEGHTGGLDLNAVATLPINEV